MLNKTKDYLANLKTKILCGILAVTNAAMISNVALCGDTGDGGTEVYGKLNNVTGFVFNVMKFGGFFMIALGVFNLVKVMASQDNSDPHGLQKGIGLLVGGIIMIAIKPVLGLFGITTDLS